MTNTGNLEAELVKIHNGKFDWHSQFCRHNLAAVVWLGLTVALYSSMVQEDILKVSELELKLNMKLSLSFWFMHIIIRLGLKNKQFGQECCLKSYSYPVLNNMLFLLHLRWLQSACTKYSHMSSCMWWVYIGQSRNGNHGHIGKLFVWIEQLFGPL